VGPEEAHFLMAASATATAKSRQPKFDGVSPQSMVVCERCSIILIHVSLKTHLKMKR
jgi:hypothetical protein